MTTVRKLGVMAMVAMALILDACSSSQTVPPITPNGISPTTYPATPTTTTTATQTEAHRNINWLTVDGAAGRLWLLGDYPCSTATCLAILRSDNGGASFVRVGAPPVYRVIGVTPSGLSIGSLLFVNREDGYAYSRARPTSKGGFYRTNDGGKTWQHVHLDGALASQIVTTGGRVYAVTYRCRSASCTAYDVVSASVTQNSWTTTTSLPSAETTGQNVSLAAFGSNVWVVLTPQRGGGSGRLLDSRDRARSFSELPPDETLGAFSCFLSATSAETLWGTCYSTHTSANVRSSDGGRRFFQIAGIPASGEFGSTSLFPLSDREGVLFFYNPAVPVARVSELEVTTDGGQSFRPILGHQEVLAVGFATGTTWLALRAPMKGKSSLSCRTANGGRSWRTVKLPSL